jgi:hypothetical protein
VIEERQIAYVRVSNRVFEWCQRVYKI